jgi:hypothetical protein
VIDCFARRKDFQGTCHGTVMTQVVMQMLLVNAHKRTEHGSSNSSCTVWHQLLHAMMQATAVG